MGRAVLIVLLALAGAAFRGGAFDRDIHQEITREALAFLRADILDDIVDDSDWPDVTKSAFSEWHCDNCMFVETIAKINEWYEGTLRELDPKSFDAFAATDWFGQLLHPAQDLYAHSNWVETMAAMGRGITLFDSGIGRKWWVGARWGEHPPGVIIAQGEKGTLPKGWGVALNKAQRLVTVTEGDGSKRYGIISGTFGTADDCHDAIAMSHGELNKDGPGRDFYEQAREHALKQTVHEWCRLESLVFLRYGQEGLKKLRETFIDPAKKSPCGEFCSLRIRAQDTARNELKGVKISVALGDGWVVDVETPFGPDVVRLGQEVKVEAPAALKEKGLVFVEWKLAERKPFGGTYMLWPLSSSPRNEWTFKVEKCDLELIARYGPPVEEGPGEVSPPPGEEPPGETPPPPGA